MSLKPVPTVHLFWRPAVAFALTTLLFNPRAYAQSTGATLSGRITDQTGATVRASVFLKNNATGFERTVSSEANGLYTILSLDAGVYFIQVAAPGFGKVVQDSVKLDVGSSRELNFTLSPGDVTLRIEVTAAAADVEADTAVVSATVGEKRIVDLPLNGRDWTQLATLQPGVISVRAQQPTTGDTNRGVRGFGNQLASNGHSPYENTYRIDGINENDYSNGAPGNVIGANLGVDAIQEFNVVTTAYTAEFGRTSGAVINAITRSGANKVHGSAYIFDRDKIFDARNFFDIGAIPPFHRAQFGGTLGGPLRKDRTFLFANYEGIRQSQSINSSSIVPSAAARTGAIHQPDGTPITVAVDPSIVPYFGLYPLPNAGLNPGTFGDTGTYNRSGVQRLVEDFVQTRFDHTFSEKDSLSLTYLYDNGPETLPDALGNVVSLLSVGRQVAAITERRIFTPNIVNVARIGYNRSIAETLTPNEALTPAAADHSLGYTSNAYAPSISVAGLANAGGLGSLRQAIAHYNSIQFDNDLSLTRGKHSLKLGFAYERINDEVQGINQNGTAAFNPSGNATGLQQFLTNQISFATLLPNAMTNPVEPVNNLVAGYLQDDWHISSNLTINLGMRYEMLTIPYDKKNRLGLVLNPVADQTTANPFACPAVFGPTDIAGCVVPAKQLFQSNPTTHNFEPRVGFSYSPYKNGGTAVRGGFGIYDILPLPYIWTTYSATAAPYSLDQVVPGAVVPQGGFPSAIATVGSVFAPYRIGHYVDQHPKRDYSMNYNLNIEQQITKTLSATIGYVGFRGVHQPFQAQEYDQVPASGTQVIDGRRVYIGSQQGPITPTNPFVPGNVIDPNAFIVFGLLFDGVEKYSSLTTQLKATDYHGLTAQGTYTWNQCTDLGSGETIDSNFTNSFAEEIYFDKAQRKGFCDYEVRQNFSANLIYEIPGPAHGVLKTFAGGWQVGGIVTASTGVPFTLVQNGDVLGQGGQAFGALPDVVPACNPYNQNFKANGLSYINTNCFVFPTVSVTSAIAPLCNQGGTTPVNGQVLCLNVQGNERRNSLVGPRLVNADLSVIKNTRLTRLSESANLQLRVEAFNVFNHTNFQAPTNNVNFGGRGSFNQESPGTAGLLDSTATTSRQVQLGAKIVF
jgi:hypothetical protein